MIATKTPLTLGRLPFLDGVRGLAILFVLLVHSATLVQPMSAPEYAIKKMLAPLWIGVDVFFVLSGFLITGILMDSKSQRHYFLSFYVRRTLRIFPLYFFALALVFFAFPPLKVMPQTPLSEQAWFWTYLFNWRAAFSHGVPGIDHFWSLAIEEQFYLVWPVLIYCIPNRRIPLLSVAIACGSILFRVFIVSSGLPIRYAYFMTPARMDDLAIGAFTACLVRDSGLCKRVTPWLAPALAVCVGAFAAAALIGRGLEPNKAPAILFGTVAVAVLTSMVIFFCSSDPRRSQRMRQFLSNRALTWMGIYSYGIYVYHVAIFAWTKAAAEYFIGGDGMARRSLRVTVITVTAITASCSVAFLSYHAFENRFLRLKSRFAPEQEAAPRRSAAGSGSGRG
jgi:peptidoglycan/LPS O-acetylase OafA/YrhL